MSEAASPTPRMTRIPSAATLLTARVDSQLAPWEALLLLRDDPRPFALVGAWAGSRAILGSAPVAVASAPENPFALLDAQPKVEQRHGCVGGGWFGYLGYQLGRLVERLPPPPPRPTPLPPAELAFYDHVLRLDRDGRWWFEALVTRERRGALEERLGELRERLGRAAPRIRAYGCRPFVARPGRSGHIRAVEEAKRHIAAGDIYQANVCLRLESELRGDPIDLYCTALARLEPRYSAFFRTHDGAVASLSPELFLRRDGRRVRSEPIKGTVPRVEDPSRAERARLGLLRSGKDRAENVMIVDLMRNDLGRVCRIGSVRVPQLAAAEAHAGVWHLVSHVAGELDSAAADSALLEATFPPGSVTGAPKIRAMEIISEVESAAREVYTGAIGFASAVAGLELNVAIRTFEVAGRRIWLGAGGGVVAESDPASEYEECLTKARPLLAAIGAQIDPEPEPERPGRPAAPAPPGSCRSPRPEVAAGVFETMLVAGGRLVELRRHLERIERSAELLFGAPLPARVGADLLERARPLRLGRLRLTARPSLAERGLEWKLEAAALPSCELFQPPALNLEPVVVPGGLGEHKWLDRRLLDEVRLPARSVPLVTDGDGTVLEAARGNIFVMTPTALLTPPLDGRILPGITRRRVFELAQHAGLPVSEEEIPLQTMLAADEVFLTGSLRGIEPVRSLAGRATWSETSVGEKLAALLSRLWRIPVGPRSSTSAWPAEASVR